MKYAIAAIAGRPVLMTVLGLAIAVLVAACNNGASSGSGY
jgi:hypothetical protein